MPPPPTHTPTTIPACLPLLQKAAAEAKLKREAIGLGRMAPQYPLPPAGEEAEAARLAELQYRQQVSGERASR